METVPLWVFLVALGVLGTLLTFGLYILKDHISKDAEVHKTVAIHEHVISKIEGHESRITKIETKTEINTNELEKIRNIRHDILDEISHKLSGWYLEIVKIIENTKAEIIRMINDRSGR